MKILSKFVRILVVFGLLSSFAAAFEENKDYLVLDKPLNVGQNVLVKVFSYGCKYCYQFDKSVTGKVVASIQGLEFKPYHLKTKGEFGETVSGILAAMMALDEQSGVGLFDDKSKFKKAKFAIYRAQHDKGGLKGDKSDVIKLALKAAGVSESDYEKALNSPRAQEILTSWDDGYDIAVISGVPAFVVNGKYLINLSSATSIDKLSEIVKFLISK